MVVARFGSSSEKNFAAVMVDKMLLVGVECEGTRGAADRAPSGAGNRQSTI